MLLFDLSSCYNIIPDSCCYHINTAPIRLLILRPKSMYSFCEEKVHTFECVAKE